MTLFYLCLVALAGLAILAALAGVIAGACIYRCGQTGRMPVQWPVRKAKVVAPDGNVDGDRMPTERA